MRMRLLAENALKGRINITMWFSVIFKSLFYFQAGF